MFLMKSIFPSPSVKTILPIGAGPETALKFWFKMSTVLAGAVTSRLIPGAVAVTVPTVTVGVIVAPLGSMVRKLAPAELVRLPIVAFS